MKAITAMLVAFVAMVGMASATITFSGPTSETTGYTDYTYLVNFASGGQMAFGYYSGGGAMYTYNNLPLADDEVAQDMADGRAAYDAFLNPPVVVPDPVVTPDEPVVTPEEPVVTPDTPVVTPDVPVVVPTPAPASSIVRIEGTDTYFDHGTEMHVISPHLATSVENTVGMGSVNETFSITTEAAEHLGH